MLIEEWWNESPEAGLAEPAERAEDMVDKPTLSLATWQGLRATIPDAALSKFDPSDEFFASWNAKCEDQQHDKPPNVRSGDMETIHSLSGSMGTIHSSNQHRGLQRLRRQVHANRHDSYEQRRAQHDGPRLHQGAKANRLHFRRLEPD